MKRLIFATGILVWISACSLCPRCERDLAECREEVELARYRHHLARLDSAEYAELKDWEGLRNRVDSLLYVTQYDVLGLGWYLAPVKDGEARIGYIIKKPRGAPTATRNLDLILLYEKALKLRHELLAHPLMKRK